MMKNQIYQILKLISRELDSKIKALKKLICLKDYPIFNTNILFDMIDVCNL